MKISKIPNFCTGCSACMAACPNNCISLSPDLEGFLYPVIDFEVCVKCYECVNVCPALKNYIGSKKANYAYYGWHLDSTIRANSSSGGIFSAFADDCLSRLGIVFGAVFDSIDKKVKHIGARDRSYFQQRKSKYVQSCIDNTFKEARNHLEANQDVLYSGSPCQISGLMNFLGKDYENLLTIDFICHGVSSMKLLKEHLNHLEDKYGSVIEKIDFRPKEFGWSKIALKVDFTNKKTIYIPYLLDSYYKGFMLENIILRKCCYQCKFAAYHVADLTLADFWGFRDYDPKLNDEKGLSLVLTNTKKGQKHLQKIRTNIELHEINIKFVEYAYKEKKYRDLLLHQSIMKKRFSFFKLYHKIGFENAAKTIYMKRSYVYCLKIIIKKLINKFSFFSGSSGSLLL